MTNLPPQVNSKIKGPVSECDCLLDVLKLWHETYQWRLHYLAANYSVTVIWDIDIP
jgi:hypothetical protein